MGLFNWQSFVDIYFWITNISNYLFVRDLEETFYSEKGDNNVKDIISNIHMY